MRLSSSPSAGLGPSRTPHPLPPRPHPSSGADGSIVPVHSSAPVTAHDGDASTSESLYPPLIPASRDRLGCRFSLGGLNFQGHGQRPVAISCYYTRPLSDLGQ